MRPGGTAAVGGLVLAASLVTGAAAQAGPNASVEVFSDSGAPAGVNAGMTNYGNGASKETLADAITFLNAQGGGVITFASSLSGHTIDLAANLPYATSDTTVTGPGASKLAVSGAGAWQPFTATGSADLTVSGLTVKDSKYADVAATNGSLTVRDTVLENGRFGIAAGSNNTDTPKITLSGDTIKDNTTVGVYVDNAAAVTITHCLVDGNVGGVSTYGGPLTITSSSIIDNDGISGIYAGSGFGDGAVTVVNSTISGNSLVQDTSSHSFGGGFAIIGVDVTLIGDTVTNNDVKNESTTAGSGAYGGGIGIEGKSGTKVLKLEDTVVAGNKVMSDVAGGAKFPDIALDTGVSGVAKDSLIGAGKTVADTGEKLTLASTDQVGTTKHPLNPKLGKLEAAGSKTATAGGALRVQKPDKGSRLIGKGAAKPFSTKAVPFKTDELGIARPAKGVTIGAYQVPSKKKHKKRRK